MLSRYNKIKFLGEGQFANVYLAKDSENTNRYVAIKKIKSGSKFEIQDGINRSALREIKILRELDHPNIIKLLDIFGEENNINLVFEYMLTDLEDLIKSAAIFEVKHIKNISIQILQGVEYLHYQFILHRDLKPNNLFLSDKGQLKIGDFGLARHITDDPERPMTTQVVTRWYRAPELLMAVPLYCFGVDMWAIGCIIGEICLKNPLFPGDSDLAQLSLIFEVIGVPNNTNWPDYKYIENRINFKPCNPTPFNMIFTAMPDDLIHLLYVLLSHDPIKRGTCTDALKHPFFANEPFPCHDGELIYLRKPENNNAANSGVLSSTSPVAVHSKRRRTEGGGAGAGGAGGMISDLYSF